MKQDVVDFRYINETNYLTMNTTIHNHNFKADQKLRDFINGRLIKLGKHFDRVTSADVFLKLENKNGTVQDKVVEIKLQVPNNQIFVTGNHKTFERSFNDALSTAQRQLSRYKERLRGV